MVNQRWSLKRDLWDSDEKSKKDDRDDEKGSQEKSRESQKEIEKGTLSFIFY